MASLLFVWRPFVHMFFAAIHAPVGDAPANCRWVRQIAVPLRWIRAFLDRNSGNLHRDFSLDTHLRRGKRIRITTDACPYGLGGVLEVDDIIVSFFSSPLSSTDREVLSLPSEPSSRDQQAAEALAMLVALRLWSNWWLDQRVCLAVQTDNVACLSLVCKMQPHSEQLGLIAREIALDVAQSS